MNTYPKCGKCGKIMTPENSTNTPELFLCDDCAPDSARRVALGMGLNVDILLQKLAERNQRLERELNLERQNSREKEQAMTQLNTDAQNMGMELNLLKIEALETIDAMHKASLENGNTRESSEKQHAGYAAYRKLRSKLTK